MTSSNELGMPIWLSTSRFAPPTDILRTKQSIWEPSNEIVPAFMTFWRWAIVIHQNPLCQCVQIPLTRPLASYTRGYDHVTEIDVQAPSPRPQRQGSQQTPPAPLLGRSHWAISLKHMWAYLMLLDRKTFEP